jgi:outer membrane lipoprotein-sorting protein
LSPGTLRRLALAALLLGSACKSGPPCPSMPAVDAAQTMAAHQSQSSRWTSLKAEARVTQWGDRGRIRGTVLMFLERPGRVRFDVMTQLGPAMVLTSDGEQFQLSDFRENLFLEGPTCPYNIQRLLGISMDADNVLRLLTGDTPRLEAKSQSMRCEDGDYVVSIEAWDGRTQEITFAVKAHDETTAEPELELRRSRVRSADGALQWEATYGDYTEVDGRSFPRRVRFVDEVHDSDTSIQVKSISVDPGVPADAFQQTVRPGMRVEHSACP